MSVLTADNEYGMPAFRRYVVSILVVAFAWACKYEIENKREDWPLSHYPMYSERAGHTWRRKSIVGISAQGEFVINGYMTAPVADATLRWALDRIGRNAKRKRLALDVFKELYDDRKQRGFHDGPPLIGLRMYEEKWRIQEDLANLTHPQRTTLETIHYPPGTPAEGRH